jgi:hypothetical protein
MSDRLLTDEEIVRATWVNPNYPQNSVVDRVATPSEVAIAETQDAQAASIVARQIFEEIEQEYPLLRYCNPWWQALKGKYLEVKGE